MSEPTYEDPTQYEFVERHVILAGYLRELIAAYRGHRLAFDGPDVLERAARTLALFDDIDAEDEW